MQDVASDRLKELARLHGIELSYVDAGGRIREAITGPLLRVLRVLGAPVDRSGDVAEALRLRREAPWRRGLEPVTVAWDGCADGVSIRLPSAEAGARLRGAVFLEGGGELPGEWDPGRLPDVAAEDFGGVAFVEKRLPLPDRLPWGCHRLVLERGGVA